MKLLPGSCVELFRLELPEQVKYSRHSRCLKAELASATYTHAVLLTSTTL